MGEEIHTISIKSLPDELISMILQNNECCDILNFGATCKEFNEIVQSDHYLWKVKFKNVVPEDIYHIVESHCNNGNWLNEIKGFYSVKRRVYSELISMSPKYYWQSNELNLQDVRNFLTIALSNNMSYYYTVQILHDVIKKGNENMNLLNGKIPYTLTEMYYAKIALYHLIHSYLAVKWVQKHMKDELYPEIVLNFFTQWTDTVNMHPDEDIEYVIMGLVNEVETILVKNDSSKTVLEGILQEKYSKGVISERQVLAAVTQVIYNQRRMAVSGAANLDTLDIVKVLKNNCGNMASVAAIYHAVARRCGVKCEVIAFPNHFFLEWRDTKSRAHPQIYRIDLETGALQPKRSCPFSANPGSSNYKYCPELLLQYIFSSFFTTMGAIDNWCTRNAACLLEFLHTDALFNNHFRNYHRYLREDTLLPTLAPINLKYLEEEHLQIILMLTYLNSAVERKSSNVVVKNRDTRVKYAVGMICCHKKYEYVCVIRGWDLACDVNWQKRAGMNLQFGPNQPFYYVIAADQSNRYVAQENLADVSQPPRLYHLEDMIAREFTHYNGFAYVPNNEKNLEYPEDSPISNMFRSRAMNKMGNEF